jgi:thioredoxin 1
MKYPYFLFILCLPLAIGISFSNCKADGQETLNPKEFKIMIVEAGTQLVDIRTPEEFALGYIEGAQNIDFYNPDFLSNISKLKKDKPLALYCKSGGRTKDALKVLADQGFSKIIALKGGLLKWESEGFTLVEPKPMEPTQKAISNEEYQKLILSDKLVIVDFNAKWCGPCKMLKPILDKISTDFANKGVKIIGIDTDESKALANDMRINEIPILLFYKNGQLVERMIGFNPESVLVATIEKYL